MDNKLPKRFKTAWLKRLRSGKFIQTDGKLQDKNGYCCLGVACSIRGVTIHAMKGCMGIKIDWGMPAIISNYKDSNRIISQLTNRNDGTGAWKGRKQTFQQIANWIEKNL